MLGTISLMLDGGILATIEVDRFMQNFVDKIVEIVLLYGCCNM